MADPFTLAILLKLAAGAAGKIAVKAYLVGKMAGLKAFLVSTLGTTAGGISAGLLATAATAIFWEKYVKKNSDDDAINAAVAKGVSTDVARNIVKWFKNNF